MIKGCICSNKGTCIACLIKTNVLDRFGEKYGGNIEIIKFLYGSQGLAYYIKEMK